MRILNIKYSLLIALTLLIIGCSKEDPNSPPTKVSLVFPTSDLLCTNSTINFDWTEATDPEENAISYNLIIATDRALTNVVETASTTSTSKAVSLEKQTAYYWKVESIDIDNNQGTSSDVYAFYTSGDAVTNYAPFTAELISPTNNGNVSSGTLDLVWKGSDPDTSDALTFEVFFGENTNLQSIANSLSIETQSVSVESGKTYSWKVNTTDENGATSIGQTWTFTAN